MWLEIEVEENLAFIVGVGAFKYVKGVGKLATHEVTKSVAGAVTTYLIGKLPGVVELDPTTKEILQVAGAVGRLLRVPALTDPLVEQAFKTHFGLGCIAYVAFTWAEGQVLAIIVASMGRKPDLSAYYQRVSQTIDRAPGMHQYR